MQNNVQLGCQQPYFINLKNVCKMIHMVRDTTSI